MGSRRCAPFPRSESTNAACHKSRSTLRAAVRAKVTAVPYRSLTLFGEVVRELEVDGICEENGRGDSPRRSGVLALEFQFGQFAGKFNPRVSPALVPSWLKTAGDS